MLSVIYENALDNYNSLVNNADFISHHTLRVLARTSPYFLSSLVDEKVHISAYKYAQSYATGYKRRKHLEALGVLKSIRSTSSITLPSKAANTMAEKLNSHPLLQKPTFRRKKISNGNTLTLKEQKKVDFATTSQPFYFYNISKSNFCLPNITYFNASCLNNSIKHYNEKISPLLLKMLKSSLHTNASKTTKTYM